MLYSIGILALVLNLIFLSSPFTSLLSVIRQRDASSISFPLSLTIFFCSVVWMLYAIGLNDNFLLIPQAAGVGLSFIQLCVILFFYLFGKDKNTQSSKNGNDIELVVSTESNSPVSV